MFTTKSKSTKTVWETPGAVRRPPHGLKAEVAEDRSKLDLKLQTLREDHGRLLEREFVAVDEPKQGRKGTSVRFLQFNMLARALSSAPKYGGFNKTVEVAKQSLEFDEFRKFRLLEEIIRHECDVVALQEIDQFDDFFQPALQHYGYQGAFLPKIMSPTLKFGPEFYSDGVALFWKQDKVDKLEEFHLHYKSGKSTETWSQVALITRFRIGAESILVATTHLKSKSGFESRRVETVKQLLRKLEDVKKPEDRLLILGDFNAEPTGENGVSAYNTVLSSPLKLRSVYATNSPEDAPYTTCKVRGKAKARTIDYIFAAEEANVVSLLQIPPLTSLPECKLPCFEYPSDHLSIGCELRFETK